MDDPQKIPDENVETPEDSTGSPVDSDNPLVIDSESEDTTTIIEFGNTPSYPEDTVVVDRLEPVDGVTDNVESVEVYYKDPETGDWIPIDNDGDEQPDVRS